MIKPGSPAPTRGPGTARVLKFATSNASWLVLFENEMD